MTREECAWAAGFFEGEGSVRLAPHRNGRSRGQLQVEVSQVDRSPLTWLQERWGGRLHSLQGSRQRAYFRWVLKPTSAVLFLRDINPHVVRPVVRRKIELALRFQDQKLSTWVNRTPEYAETQNRFVAEMRLLNLRAELPVEQRL